MVPTASAWGETLDAPPRIYADDWDSLADQVSQAETAQEAARKAMEKAESKKQTTAENKADTPKEKKRRWGNPFSKRAAKREDDKPVPEAKIVNVGPRKTAEKTDPLLRLPAPVRLGEVVLTPGFYSVRFSGEPKATGVESQTISLFQKNLPMGSLVLQAEASSRPGDGFSPVQPLNPDKPAPPVVKLNTLLSPDLKTLTITMRVNEKTFRGPPLHTILENLTP